MVPGRGLMKSINRWECTRPFRTPPLSWISRPQGHPRWDVRMTHYYRISNPTVSGTSCTGIPYVPCMDFEFPYKINFPVKLSTEYHGRICRYILIAFLLHAGRGLINSTGRVTLSTVRNRMNIKYGMVGRGVFKWMEHTA